ncbi:MAG: amidohydrolase [Spirochaetes bacterium]|nr:amidohydrolase [Spirochaetota bacterium]
MRDLNVAIIQAEIAWHAPEENLSRFDTLIRRLEGPVDLVLLPEMFATGFTMEPGSVAEDMEGPAILRMREWAVSLGADIAGSLAIAEGGYYYNRLVWVRSDGVIATYDKRHLFRMAGEDRVYLPGSETITVETRGWKLRPFICYDLRFPAWTRNAGMEYDAAVFVANWPAKRSLHWEALLTARAIENQCYVIGVNRVGTDGNGVAYRGDSMAVDYEGTILATMGEGEGAMKVVLSKESLEEYRAAFPAWKDADQYIFT